MEHIKTAMAKKIIGEIVLADNPGEILKKWRKILKVSQNKLAQHIGMTPSVISDYENNRRRSPGIGIIRKMVLGMVSFSHVESSILKEFNKVDHERILDMREFVSPIPATRLVKLLRAKPVTEIKNKVYGYTLIDSIKTIIEFSPAQLEGIYGVNHERALIFTDVRTGRSPMIAIKIGGIKPSLVILQTNTVDGVAKRIAEVEEIPLAITQLSTDKMIEKLKTI